MARLRASQTLLIVGEGRHEEAFLNHLKRLYVTRGCGLSVTIKNARGKGAKHVVEWTIRQINNAAYDDVAVLLDTDKDWSLIIAKKAKQNKIVVFASDPCFEAVLLRALGKHPVGDAKALKRTIAPYLKNDATIRDNYQEYFGDEQLQVARTREPTIDKLLKALKK
ncbi:MAG: RloB domain-containing protein [Mariprofundaceae bacterium]